MARRPAGPDRRRTCRYPLDAQPAHVGWWSSDQFHSSRAVLLDLSLDGLRVLSELPPPERHAFVSPDAVAPPAWIEFEVLQVSSMLGRSFVLGRFSRGRSLVRGRFPEGCPYPFYRAVMPGISLSGPGNEHLQDQVTQDGRYWRWR